MGKKIKSTDKVNTKERSRGQQGKQLVGRVPNMYWLYLVMFVVIFAIFNSLFGGALGGIAWLLGVDPMTMLILILMLAAIVTFLFINLFRR